MGNSCSQYASGGIYIQTDQAFYIAGDTVTGKVHVSVLDSFPANCLSLKVKGYEESFWQEQHTRQKTVRGSDGQEKTSSETYYETYKGKNTFFSHKFPLYVWSGFSYMPAGQYTFPFQFKLLDTLPGTYQETGTEKGGDYKAIIKYKVKVEIDGSNHKKLKNKQDLVVREPLKNIVSSQYGEKVVKPSTWCCLSQGQSHIKCSFERNSYMPGETAQMLADIDNSQCELAINNLSCQLQKRLRLTSSSGRELLITRTVSRREFQGVAARSSATGASRRNVDLSLQSTNGQTIQPSTRGRLVNCDYNLNITAHLEGCICCSDIPEVTVPIAIVSPPPVNYGVVQTPPNWNPQVFEVKTFAFTSDCMYTKGIPPPISMNVNMNIPPPQMGIQINSNLPPPPQMEVHVNSNSNYVPPPQMGIQINAGNPPPPFGNPPPPQMGIQMNVGGNPPPPQMGIQMNTNVSDPNYNNNGNANVNMGMNMGMGMNFNMQVTETHYEEHHTNNNNNGNVNMNVHFG